MSFCTPSASHPNSSRETLSLRSSPSLSSPSSHTPLPPSLFSSTRVMLSDNPLPPYEARATANVDFNPYPANICQSPAPLLPPGEIATTSYDEQPAVICQSPAPLLPPEGVAIDSLVLQPANSSQSPPPLLLYKGIAAVSVDIQPANISHSPTPLLSPKGIGTVSFDLQPANISESPPPPFSPKGIAAVSFDVQAANVSESPTHRKPTSPTRTSSHQATRRPTTLNTQSDSPRHHVTHLPTVHSRQVLPGSINGVMVIPQMHVPPNQFENTFLQGTFTPRRPCNVVPNERPLPSVAQATEDERMAHGQPRPHPVSSSERPPDIWRSNFPGKFPPARQLEPETVIFSRFVSIRSLHVQCACVQCTGTCTCTCVCTYQQCSFSKPSCVEGSPVNHVVKWSVHYMGDFTQDLTPPTPMKMWSIGFVQHTLLSFYTVRFMSKMCMYTGM